MMHRLQDVKPGQVLHKEAAMNEFFLVFNGIGKGLTHFCNGCCDP